MDQTANQKISYVTGYTKLFSYLNCYMIPNLCAGVLYFFFLTLGFPETEKRKRRKVSCNFYYRFNSMNLSFIFLINKCVVWLIKCQKKVKKMLISVSYDTLICRFVNNLKVYSLLPQRSKETRKYSHSQSWNQRIWSWWLLQKRNVLYWISWDIS